MTTNTNTYFISRKAAWIILLVIVLIALAIVAAPVWIIQPFKPQTARGLEISFALRRWSPLVTVIALVLGLLLVGMLARRSRWWGKALLHLIMLPPLASTRFARHNPFAWVV